MSEDSNDTGGIKHLWAPWRLDYVRKTSTPKKDSCVFCDIAEIGVSEETLIHYMDSDIFIVQNKFPYNPGHLLVIPRAHCANPEDLEVSVWQKLNLASRLCLEILKTAMGPQGFNMGLNLGSAAGAGIPTHLHWHLLPRWSGDTNFMPLLAETKSIPTHNLTIYRQLNAHFEGFQEKLKLLI